MRSATIVWNDRRLALRAIAQSDRMAGRVERLLFNSLAERLEKGIADGTLSPYRVPMWFEPFEDRHGGVLHVGPSPVEVERRERAAAHRRRLREDAIAGALALGVEIDATAEEVEAALEAVARRGATPVATPADGLARLSEATAVVARAEAARLAIVVELAGAGSSGSTTTERHKLDELAIATGLSLTATASLIARARLLHGPMACFGQALAEGEVSFLHCLALIGQCENIADEDVLRTIAEHALPFAQRMVVADFRRQVVALIAQLDPDAEARARKAAARRTVYKRRDTDGMSFLGVLHQTRVINALYDQIVEDGSLLLDARRSDADAAENAATDDATGIDLEAAARGAALTEGDLSPDACRADALAARMLGTVNEDGSVTWDPSANVSVTVEVVIDLDTLNGLADKVVLVDGEPMPADVGRELAYVAQWFRRVIVDPVDGHLLDYGDRTYLPDPVRRFCFARDRGCRAPNCTRRAARFLQLDHAQKFPDGPSSVGNCGALCTRCHQQKTTRHLDIDHSRPDGSARFTTPWGQRVHVPARPYLPTTAPAPHRATEAAPITVAADQPDTPPF